MSVRVLQLDHLHQPLHVAERSAAELQVPGGVRSLREPLVLHARLDALDLAYVRVADGVRVAGAVGQRREVDDEAAVADDSACAQQRLRLPREGPALVVGAVGRERAHHGTVASLRSEAGVEVEREARVLREARQLGDDELGAALGQLGIHAGDRAEHVHDVGVGAEAELGAAVAPHRDHGELGPGAVLAADGAHDATKRRRGDVGQGGSEGLDVRDAHDGADGEAEDLAAAEGAQRGRGGVGCGMPVHRGDGLLLEGRPGAGAQVLVAREPRGGLGDAVEQLRHEA